MAELSTIADPRERAAEAAKLVRYATGQADKARLERNRAAMAMYALPDISAAEVWRDTLNISRNLWNRILKSFKDGKLDPIPPMSDPAAVARRAAARAAHWDTVVTEARDVRDEAALALMDGSWGGPPLRNAEVVALTELTSARVAQMRTAF